MKTLRYIVWSAAVCAALASCTKDPAAVRDHSGSRRGVPVEMNFNLFVVDPAIQTRSLASELASDNLISDLNIFVFDAASGDLDGYAYASGLTGGTGTVCSVRGTSGERTLAVIANAGQSLAGEVADFSDLEALTGGAFIVDGYAVMAGTLPVTVPPPGVGSNVVDVGEIELKRLMSKVTVTFDKSELNANGEYDIFTIAVQSITLRQVPTAFTYLPSASSPSTTFTDGDYIEYALEPEDHASATPLYMPENMQGTKVPSLLNVQYHYMVGDVPTWGMRYSSPVTMVPEDEDIGRCSYVEIVADYDNYKLLPGEGFEGTQGRVVYKIFLGTGLGVGDPEELNWDNFDVRRNTWYKVTVKLSGQAGKMEASWRIDTELIDISSEEDDTGEADSYTIDPEDALYWTVEDATTAFRRFSTNNGQLAMDEYYEGRWSTWKLASSGPGIGQYPAAKYCFDKNDPAGGTWIDNTIYYLPSQNELQMLNIHRNAAFVDGVYWSSTQLQEGENSNKRARVINFANFGEAYTRDKNREAYVRCLRVPDRPAGWDGKVYPYVDAANGHPVIVNRETNPDGTPRGVKAFALRTGMLYARLTPYYHTLTKPYKAYRVAMFDCGPDGEQIVPGETSPRLNWYQAMGYVQMTSAEEAAAGPDYAPEVNLTRTGCNAYYEDGDMTQIGKWRVPTSLELQQLWIMGASYRGSRPADPNAASYLDAAGNVTAPRLPGITELAITGYYQVFGDNTTLMANTGALDNPGYPTYSLDKCYWSASTTTMAGGPYANNAYAYKMDLYSGDGYAGIQTGLARPSKQDGGLVRCVMDVVK